MSAAKTCPKCGTMVPEDAPHGSCPVCVLGGMLSGSRVRYFGDYELLDEIARGGMGVVYRARQVSLNRPVALKMILSAHLAGEEAIKRFRHEAEAAAHLDHPNIVPIYEVGEHEGQHYFSMKLVEGGTLAQPKANDACRMTNEERIRGVRPFDVRHSAFVISQVARAVHYAHQRGLLHRDLKPANILIDTQGQPHVTDFGLAKQIEGAGGLTHSGAVLGTPNYMAPEQAAGASVQLTTAADVYALGAILYHLLTGRPPFEAGTVLETLLLVKERAPSRPSALTPRVGRDLETICLKCLEKEPARRYGSAEALAEDLERWQRGEPIHARPVPGWERAALWTKRRPAIASLAAGLVFALLAGMAGIGWYARQAHRHAAAETRQRQRAERGSMLTELQRAEDLFGMNNAAEAVALLARLVRQSSSNRLAAERLLSALSCRNFLRPVAVLPHEDVVNRVAYSPRGDRVATGGNDCTRLWEAPSGKPIGECLAHGGWIVALAFNPNGDWLVTAGFEGRAKVWNATNGLLLAEFARHTHHLSSVAVTPDGLRVLTGARDGTARVWEALTGRELLVLSHPAETREHAIHAEFSHNGRRIVTADRTGRVRVWDSHTGNLEAGPFLHRDFVNQAEFSPDGSLVVSASVDNTARIWPVSNVQRTMNEFRHNTHVGEAHFSPDTERVLTVSRDWTARLWNTRTGQPEGVLMQHRAAVESGQFSRDGTRIATGSLDQTARIWDGLSGRPVSEFARHEGRVQAVRWSPDQRHLLTGCAAAKGQLWEVPAHPPWQARTLPEFAGTAWLEFSPDGQRLALAVTEQNFAQILDAATLQPITPQMRHTGHIESVRFSADGRKLVTACSSGEARVWDAFTGRPLTTNLFHQPGEVWADFSPDGQRLVTAAHDRGVRLWDAQSGRLHLHPGRAEGQAHFAAFSPDGRAVVAGYSGGTVRVWNATTGDAILEFKPRHRWAVRCVQFSPDGSLIASASEDSTVRLWNTRSGQLAAPSLKHDRDVTFVRFSPDGGRLLTVSDDHTARLWDSCTGHPLAPPLGHGDMVKMGQFSRDGRRIVTASFDGTARVWDAETGKPLSEPLRTSSPLCFAEFSPDGQRVIAASRHGSLSVWETPSPDSPAPGWLPALAEALVGARLDERGILETVAPSEFMTLKASLTSPATSDLYARWAARFFAEPEQRTRRFSAGGVPIP